MMPADPTHNAKLLYTRREDRDDRRIAYNEMLTGEDWKAVVGTYPDRIRHHAANLAAHNWDVVALEDRLLVSCARSGGNWCFPNGTMVQLSEDEMDRLYPRVPYSAKTLQAWRNAASTTDANRQNIKRQYDLDIGAIS